MNSKSFAPSASKTSRGVSCTSSTRSSVIPSTPSLSASGGNGSIVVKWIRPPSSSRFTRAVTREEWPAPTSTTRSGSNSRRKACRIQASSAGYIRLRLQ